MRLRNPDEQRESHIRAPERFEYFAQKNTRPRPPQMLIHGVTRMYLILKACRSDILTSTPTIATAEIR